MSFARYGDHFADSLLAILLITATLGGCAGNGNGLDSSGNPISPGGGGGSGELTADFQSIQDHIFTPICTKCHIGAGAPEGLQLDQAHSYSLLVGVPSTEQPAVLRVAPGNPDNSYIIRKLEGNPSISGDRMPFGGPYLSQATIDVIRQWITNGAAAAATKSLQAAVEAVRRFDVEMTAPGDGAIASMPVPRIIVSFSGELDPNLHNDTTVRVVRLPSEAAEAPVLVSASVPAGNPAALLITPRTPLTNGVYRVTLRGVLANMSAQPLGADYTFTFTVDVLQ
jgi:hypothetical protein